MESDTDVISLEVPATHINTMLEQLSTHTVAAGQLSSLTACQTPTSKHIQGTTTTSAFSSFLKSSTVSVLASQTILTGSCSSALITNAVWKHALQEHFFGHINDQKEEAALQKPLSANKYLDINININRTPASYTSTKHAYIDIYVYAKTQVSNSRYSKRAARESPVLRIRG